MCSLGPAQTAAYSPPAPRRRKMQVLEKDSENWRTALSD